MPKVVIIGAGLTGLSLAYLLEKNNFFDYQIFEKDQEAAGLLKSVQKDGFTFDCTGHFLHISHPEFREFLDQVLGLENCDEIQRSSFVYQFGRYIPYPFQSHISFLPEQVALDCIVGFLEKKKNLNPKTFYSWVMTHFGEGFANHFFIPYNEKLLNTSAKKISASWTSRFVPNTSIEDLLRNLIFKEAFSGKGYNASFFYPKRGGIQSLIKGIEAKLKNKIKFLSELEFFNLKTKKFFFSSKEVASFEHLVNTAPLPVFLNLTNNSALRAAACKLKANSVLCMNFGVNKPNLSDKHWIYYPEKKYPFYRVGFWNNFGPLMAPLGCSSIYAEVSLKNGSDLNLIKKKSIQELSKIFNFAQTDIIVQHDIFLKHAYVCYDFWREKNLGEIHKQLISKGVLSIGRFGEWKYSSMQEAYFDAKKVLQSLGFLDK